MKITACTCGRHDAYAAHLRTIPEDTRYGVTPCEAIVGDERVTLRTRKGSREIEYGTDAVELEAVFTTAIEAWRYIADNVRQRLETARVLVGTLEVTEQQLETRIDREHQIIAGRVGHSGFHHGGKS
ncbi:MAG: hypothetical protein HRU13_12415 [Phycisphaerales bacterium]|nr:hypothetical protein [Phycisphaerales bacterium]